MRVDPAVLQAVRACLPLEPEPPIAGWELAAAVALHLRRWSDPPPLRRIQEAVAALRAQGVPVVSSCKPPRGYRVGTSDAVVNDCAREHQRRALESLRMAARLRRLTVKEVAAQMGLFQEAGR